MTIPNVVLGELIDPVTFGNAVVDAVNEHETEISDRLPLSGGTVTGDLQVNGRMLVNKGSGAAPGLAFSTGDSQQSTGLFYNSDYLGLVRDGNTKVLVYPDQVRVKDADLQVDGQIILAGSGARPGSIQSLSGRSILQIRPDSTASPTLLLHGDNDASTDTMSIKGSDGGYMVRLHGDGLFQVFGQIQDENGPVRSFAIADGIDTADVLDRAETATMPALDDEGVATTDAEVESITVNEVVTALLAKVKQLSARIETLEGN